MKSTLTLSIISGAAMQLALAATTNTVFSLSPHSVRFGTRPVMTGVMASEQRADAVSPLALRLASGAVETAVPKTKRAMAQETAASAQVRTARQRLPVLVQFDGPPSPAARAALEKAGCHIAGYIAPHGYLLEAPEGQLGELAGVPRLRWLGEYKPAYKLSPGVTAARSTYEHARARYVLTNSVMAGVNPPRALPPLNPPALEETIHVTVHLFSAEDIDTALVHMRALGARDLGAAAGGAAAAPWGRIRARVPFDALDAIANLAAVQWIEPYTEPKLFNSLAVQPHLMNITPVWSTNWLGLTGRGQIVAHADTGLDQGSFSNLHADFTNRIHAVFAWGRAGVWSDPDGHGTHTAGSLAGNGSAYSNGLFKAPAYEARLVHQSLYVNSAATLGGVPTNLNLLFQQAYATNARIHSCSWGYSAQGAYTWASRDADEFMWNRPDMLLVFAAGNDSEDADGTGVVNLRTIAAPASAKNVLTVGATESGRAPGSGGYTSEIYGNGDWEPWFPANPIHDDLISSSADGIHQGMFAMSSRGPTADGRIKPDVVAPGTDIISCRSFAPGASTYWGLFPGHNRYMFLGGTSASTPLTASAAALARQYFIERHVPAISNPSAALIKATLLCGARSLSPGQYGYRQFREIPPPPRPNPVEGWGQVNLAASLSNLVVWDMQPLTSDATNVYELFVSETNALSVLLAWTDYPGTLGAAQALVNDLDVQVILPDGSLRFPNGLNGPDKTNNVEGIDVDVVPPGVCTVLVSGVVNMGVTQHFALAVRSAAPVTLQHYIEAVSHEPKTVRSTDMPLVTAVIYTNFSGLADATLYYRVDGGAWSSLTLAEDLPFERGALYTNAIPAHPIGSYIEYFATALANDGAFSSSATQSYYVADYVVCVWEGGTQTPPYATWATAFSNLHEAITSAFVTEGFDILISNGTYYSFVSGVGDGIIVNKGVRIIGNGREATRLSGGYLTRVLTIINAKASVENLTITEGFASSGQGVLGGGVYMLNGVVRNCLFHDNYSYAISGNGGGIVIDGNGLADACFLRDNYAIGGWVANGGGAFLTGKGTLRSCALVNNIANSGLNNASGGNVAIREGGFLSNCTVVAGTAQQNYGGGVYIFATGSVHNCIVYFNNNGNFSLNNEGNPHPAFFQWNYTCVTPLPSGTGVSGTNNFTSNPLLVNYSGYDVHLRRESPCRDAGEFLPWMTNALDADGRPRVNGAGVDVGALEFGPFNVSFVATPLNGLAPLPVRFTAYPSGENTNFTFYAWDFNNDGSNDLEGFIYDRPTNFYPEGLYSPVLVASNELGEIASWTRKNYIYAYNTNIHYVAHGGAHVWPFTSLANASTSIVEALDACISGHGVVISDGVYRVPYALDIMNGISIRSMNGRDRTILDGQRASACLYLYAGALAEGLTLSNGYAYRGGAVTFSGGGTLRNARLVSNSAFLGGGGAYFEYGGTLEFSEIFNNYGNTYGGGIFSWGGGLVRNCIIYNNRSDAHGGGVSAYPNSGLTLRNCLIVSNVAYSMGGGYSATADSTVENCTIAFNVSRNGEGGGLSIFDANVAVRNTIIYTNRALAKPATDNWATNRVTSINFQNVCTLPRAGSNWLTNDPRFVSIAARNFRLRADSPCINAAQNLSWMSTATDLDGTPRIRNGAPDLGAYELATNVPLLRVTVSATDFNPLTSLNFGTLQIDATNSRTLCVRNVGGSWLTGEIQNLELPFWSSAPLEYVLGINSNRVLTFFFSPPSDVAYTNLLTFTGGGDVFVTLAGTGIPEPGVLALLVLCALAALQRR